MKSLILTVLIGLCALTQAKVSYENYKVYRVVPSSAEQVKSLKELEDKGFDFWTDIYDVGSDVRIMTSPAKEAEFKLYSQRAGFNATVAVPNVQDLMNAQLNPNPNARNSRLLSFSWDRYHTLEEIYTWLDELASTYPNYVRTVTIGTTYEGREIKGVIIDLLAGNREGTPLVGMIEGGIHSREWISPATVTWIIKEFLTSDNPDVQLMAEALVWHIFPVANPDGYAYTFNGDRMWRKNRNPTNAVSCPGNNDLGNGIDLNRNFNFVWMSIGASQNPCTQTYAGPSAASELETQAFMNYVLQIRDSGNMIYYLAFHSYTQLLIIPYSHVSGLGVLEVENYGDLYEIGIRGAEKLAAVYGTQYRVGVSTEILYSVSGSSMDWAKGVANIPITYLFELRDLGAYGFLLPADQIIPNNEEVMEGLIEMEKTTRRLGYYSYSRDAASGLVSSLVALISGVAFLALTR